MLNAGTLKRGLKSLAGQALFYGGLPSVFVRCGLSTRGKFPAVIINYHSFSATLDSAMEAHPTVNILINDFERQLIYLKKNFQIISLDTLVDALKMGERFDRPTIAITIDDGFKDNFDLLFPVVQKHGAPVTIFLATGFIGTNRRIWVNHIADMVLNTTAPMFHLNGIFAGDTLLLDTLDGKRATYMTIVRKLKDVDITLRDEYIKKIENQLGAPPDARTMLNWDEVRQMHKAGISFGAHTVNHPILTNMPLSDAKKEITDSKNKIEQELGVHVRHFAYPNGRPRDFSDELRAHCREIGFDSVGTCDYGNNRGPTDTMSLKRIGSELPMGVFALNVIRSFKSDH